MVRCVLAIVAVGLLSAATARAADVAPETAFLETLPLGEVKWATAAPNMKSLEDKTVIVLIWASWCPKCNQWSGDLFTELKGAIQGKPVVILAINADSTPNKIEDYVTERGFFAPNVLFGYDPNIKQKLGLDSELFRYFRYDPKGKLATYGFAPQLPGELKSAKDLGKFRILPEDPSEAVAAALWPLELGVISDGAITKARKSLSNDDKAKVDASLNAYLAREIEAAAKLQEGGAEDKFHAYDRAAALAGSFKTSAEGKKAKEIVLALDKDSAFKREAAAKKAYEGLMQKTAIAPAMRDKMLRALAQRFSGTIYGKKAAASVGGG